MVSIVFTYKVDLRKNFLFFPFKGFFRLKGVFGAYE